MQQLPACSAALEAHGFHSSLCVHSLGSPPSSLAFLFPSHPSHCASVCLLLLPSEARCFAATFFFPGKKKQPPSNSPCHESGFQFAACAARWGWEQVTPGRVAVCAGKVRAGSMLSSFLVGDCAFSAKLPLSTCSSHAECFPHLLDQTALPVKVD